MYNFGAASQYQHEGYNFGAATSTPASAAALGTAFSQFASTVTRFADSLPSSQAAWASSLRNAVSSLARGMNNVLAGTLPAAPWLRSVNDILLQIRQEQSGGMSLAQSLVDAIATSASAVGRAAQTLVVEVARTAGTAVRAAGEGAGVTPSELAEELTGTVKLVAGAGIVLGLGYLVFSFKPRRK